MTSATEAHHLLTLLKEEAMVWDYAFASSWNCVSPLGLKIKFFKLS